ncbi:hypothetical protein HPB50_015223 [Hyalomma asiaticum]|uniref:Uncharacterized protein n=1 Tax=Hyalomma asiaticum TaxID=266040 RepID=A0ACB7SNI7_HYAAI|nr:hypothetical protein HPB50_015223 [Hyalomma asiaticum]
MSVLSDDEDASGAVDLSPEEELLHAARSGSYTAVENLLNNAAAEKVAPNVDCKGRLQALLFCTQKANLGWTPLHLACYFGHFDVAELLLEHGAYVDVINREGDTPLHKAAYTGREGLVMLLLKHNADVFIINCEGQSPRQVAKDEDIKRILAAAETADAKKKADKLFAAAKEGNMQTIQCLCDPTDEAAFAVVFPEDPAERLAVPPVENDKVDRMKWVAKLKEHIEFSRHYTHQGMRASDSEEDEPMPLGSIEDVLSTAQAQQQLLERGVDRAASLHASLVQLLDAHRLGLVGPCQELLSQWHELLLLSRSVASSLSKCTLLLKQQEESRAAELAQERERSRVLQESLSVLAREHHQLECTLSNPRLNHIPEDESEEEFFDAFEGGLQKIVPICIPQKEPSSMNSDYATSSSSESNVEIIDLASTPAEDSLTKRFLDEEDSGDERA